MSVQDIKKPNVLHRPMQTKIYISILIFTLYIINQICRTILHSDPLVTLLKRFILFVTGVLEQPARETVVMTIS